MSRDINMKGSKMRKITEKTKTNHSAPKKGSSSIRESDDELKAPRRSLRFAFASNEVEGGASVSRKTESRAGTTGVSGGRAASGATAKRKTASVSKSKDVVATCGKSRSRAGSSSTAKGIATSSNKSQGKKTRVNAKTCPVKFTGTVHVEGAAGRMSDHTDRKRTGGVQSGAQMSEASFVARGRPALGVQMREASSVARGRPALGAQIRQASSAARGRPALSAQMRGASSVARGRHAGGTTTKRNSTRGRKPAAQIRKRSRSQQVDERVSDVHSSSGSTDGSSSGSTSSSLSDSYSDDSLNSCSCTDCNEDLSDDNPPVSKRKKSTKISKCEGIYEPD